MKKAFGIIQIFLVFILGIVIFLNLYIIYNQVLLFNNYPTIFGLGHTVITDDQSELHDENDFLITYRQGSYQKDDEIVYENSLHEISTGKVYQANESEYYISEDKENKILPNSVKGKVLYTVKGIGGFISWLNSSLGMIVLLMSAVLIIEVPKFVDIIKLKIVKR